MWAYSPLPVDYSQRFRLDLTANAATLRRLNGWALVIFGLSLLGFGALAWQWQPGIWSLLDQGWRLALMVILVFGLTIILHELIHGLFFLLFTRARPEFGLSWRYAYAAAPAWYIRRNPFLIITMAPLCLILLLGLGGLYWGSPTGAIISLIMLLVNTAGATGDIYIFVCLWPLSPEVLVNDTGAVFAIYEKKQVVRHDANHLGNSFDREIARR